MYLPKLLELPERKGYATLVKLLSSALKFQQIYGNNKQSSRRQQELEQEQEQEQKMKRCKRCKRTKSRTRTRTGKLTTRT